MESIVDIIPKITSPLAVICFAFYIFYLFKRSQDEKKEKSLTVSDKKAQGDAARLILKDYPDLEIDKITNPSAAVEIARQIVSDNLKKHNKTLDTLLLFSLIFAVTFLVSLWISRSIIPEPKSIITKTNESWAKIESVKREYPYASLSIVQHIKLLLSKRTDSTEEMVAEFRNHYILSANRDIAAVETIFEEQYSTSMGEIEYWQGTHKQKIKSNDPKNYWVHFDLKKNDIKSILTGADYHYRLPLKNNDSPSCFSDLVVNPEEYFTCYPNSLDYIDDLTIVVESNDFILTLPPNSTLRKVKPEGDEIVSEGSCKVYMNKDLCTLSANWSRITPGECVGFKFKWARRK